MSQKIDLKVECTNRLAQENEALRGQIETLRKAIIWYDDCDSASQTRRALRDMLDAAKATPAQCLAEIKALALEDEAQLWPDDLTECSHVRSSLLESANQLRQQAKEQK